MVKCIFVYIIANSQRKGKRESERERDRGRERERVRLCGEMESQQGVEHGAQQTERIRNVKNTMVCVNIDRANRAVFLPMSVCVSVCVFKGKGKFAFAAASAAGHEDVFESKFRIEIFLETFFLFTSFSLDTHTYTDTRTHTHTRKLTNWNFV